MAGDWLKVERALLEKPEVLEMAERLKIDRHAIIGKLFEVWFWFDEQTSDGNASIVTSVTLMKRIDERTCVPGFAECMQSMGWLNGTSIPNFARHNGESAKKRALTKDRVKRFRNAHVTPDALPEKRRSKSIVSSLRSETVNEGSENSLPENPTPSPRTPGRPHRTEAEKLLAFLNEKTGKGFRPVDSNLRLIEARLASGVPPLRVKQVILRKWREWKDRDDMAMYLRPDTLFNATKFEQYLGEIPPERAPIHDLMEDDHAEEARP